MKTEYLQKKAKWIRLEVVRAAQKSGIAHIGGTFSCVELLVALYYLKLLKFNPKKPAWTDRDRFIFSKGHACTALFAIFLDLGVISKIRYNTYGTDGGLGGQLDMSIPGVDFITGSLGHSLGIAAGMAKAAKLSQKIYKVYTILGDSEFFEGSTWESVIFAGDQGLNNLVVIVDRNRLMVTDAIDNEGVYKNFQIKIENFGWDYQEINGHNFEEISAVFKRIKSSKKPTLIIANTVKGKSVTFMENNPKWHNALPSEMEFKQIIEELT